MRSDRRFITLICLLPTLLGSSARPGLAAAGRLTIQWTAPGDDSLTGRATAYDMRSSTAPITAANFNLATRVLGVPAPRPAGSAESFSVTNLLAGTTYYFALKTSDEAANWSKISNVVQGTISTTTARLPMAVFLSSPYPNPSHGHAYAHWAYSLAVPGPIVIDAFDAAGRHIASIEHGVKPAGQSESVWNLNDKHGSKVAAGVYLVRATFAGRTVTQQLVVTH